MIRHVFKLVWNRKRTNALLVLEMGTSFLVLFAVAAVGLYCLDAYRRPLGFSWQNVWCVGIDTKAPEEAWGPAQAETVRQLVQAARSIPEVEQVAIVSIPPFTNSSDMASFERPDGSVLSFGTDIASDSFPEVMGMTLEEGRWFSAEDDGASYKPVVVNRALARAAFGDKDPIGKALWAASADEPEQRVVGVIADFRKNGELTPPANFAFGRADSRSPSARASGNLMLRLRPGSPRSAEARIYAALQAVARDWSFEIRPLSETRALANRVRMAPLLAALLVAAFLILMVALGLTGVLWQNVTQRTKEIGLRRAKGATARDIQKQILGELAVLVSAGILLGGLIAIQLPLLALVGSITRTAIIAAFALAVLLLYGLTLLCGAYPSRMASRITPVQALHYE